MRYPATDVSHSVAQMEKQGTDGEKPQPHSDEHPQCDIQAHHAAAGDDRPEEQCRRCHYPEQEIQQTTQPGQGQTYPENAEQVIERPQCQTKDSRSRQGERLTGNIDLHQRRSLEKKPPLADCSS